jgi:hypothetical protein
MSKRSLTKSGLPTVFLFLSLLSAPLLTQAGDVGFLARGTNAVLVLPPAGDVSGAPTWATGRVYTAGAKVLAGVENKLYICLSPGISGTNSAVFGGGTVTDGTVLWRRPLGRARTGLAITVDVAGDAYVSMDGLATTNAGIWLKAGFGPFQLSPFGAPQGGISVISTSATYTVTGAEW